MGVTQYIGARYVPIFADPAEWNSTRTYDPLTIVINNGNSYTAKQYVPQGIDIADEKYWALTGNYNAQVESYRKEVNRLDSTVTNTLIPAINTNSEDIKNEITRAEAAEADITGTMATSIADVKNYVDTKTLQYLDYHKINEVDAGEYTLGICTVNDTVNLTKAQYRQITIANSVITLNTDVFLKTPASSYTTLPCFVNCIFIGDSEHANVICSGDNNIVGSKIVGCTFINVDLIHSTNYVQDVVCEGCYIQSKAVFLYCSNTVQFTGIGCSVESESKKLVECSTGFIRYEGVIEGNETADYYFITMEQGMLSCFNAWIEGTKFAELTGTGTARSNYSTVTFNSCNLVASKATMLQLANPKTTELFFIASWWSPYDANSLFTNAKPSELYSLIGYPLHRSAQTYSKPLGGEDGTSYTLASLADVNNTSSAITSYYDGINLATTPKTFSFTQPGQYTLKISRLSGSSDTSLAEVIYDILFTGAKELVYTKRYDSNDTAYVSAVTITLDKSASAITLSAINPAWYRITLLKG